MNEVPFTQYLTPNGEKRKTYKEVTDEIYAIALELINVGAYFEAEILQTGEVSLTCDLPNYGIYEILNLSMAISPNGPEINENVEKLILEAKRSYEHFLRELPE